MVPQWRIPLAIGGVPCLILAIWVLRLPESPRYLIQRGQIEDARKVCEALHRDPKHPTK
jgi:hypothetical protein